MISSALAVDFGIAFAADRDDGARERLRLGCPSILALLNGLSPRGDVLFLQVEDFHVVCRPLWGLVQRLCLVVEFEPASGQRFEFLLLDRCRPAQSMPTAGELLQGQRVHTQTHFDPGPTLLTHSAGQRLQPLGRQTLQQSRVRQEAVLRVVEQITSNDPAGGLVGLDTHKTHQGTATLSIAFAGLRGPHIARAANGLIVMQGRDIRRSIETRLQALGVEREVRAQLLSHGRTAGVQQRHYERHDYLVEKAAALSLLEDHILDLMTNPRSKAPIGKLPATASPASSAKNSVANSVAKYQKGKMG